MALTIAGAAAGSAALAAYLDARFHIRNDIKAGSNQRRAAGWQNNIAEQIRNGKTHVYHILEDQAKDPSLVFIIFEGREYTYAEFFKAIHPIGNWLMKDLGIRKGEMVALDGGNSPEYVMLWFALEAIGASIAFINCNLTAHPLVHSVKIAGARYLLADSDVRHLVSPVEEELTSGGTQTIYFDPTTLAAHTDPTPLPEDRRAGAQPTDVASLIYTSGTTGKPKGTIVSRARTMLLRQSSNKIGLLRSDKMYTCLPLYHASAQGVCCLPILATGATMVLGRKFSHQTFWPTIHSSHATIIQYVGELCRYVVNAPPSPLDRGHKVRMAWGNGMRADVWEPFRERFGIEEIYEFYSSTDGMGIIANANRGDFSRGCIAVRGPLWHYLNGAGEARVCVDPDTREMVRGKDGFAVRCKTDQPGELLYRLDPKNEFGVPRYYGNEKASLERMVRDVFVKGDLWLRIGDLMRLDRDGRLFFVDRLGDTFRWHSENVSTTEVGDVVGLFPQIAEANVYGVEVPNSEGRAGCVAVVAAEGVSSNPEDIASGRGLDLKGLAEHCLAELPRYAVPVFIRVSKQLEYTGTMKLQKGQLRAEGVDLDAIEKAAKEKGEEPDVIYWLPPTERRYIPFSKKDLQELKRGRVRL
ncbi:fatty acid transporter [Annulohypoxylon maeteangense]|uniref:fatty acid transporter n=1 Tax=Annulohypoxylon maeteangense TaxID=1927788 RepID=UPI0020074DBE|nr:fatty acid transporter [Annulohypoxylon maeteangense]KAI0883885.1 fatty acid transporter [Annulohypoxylon maeteangense]